MTFKRIRFVKNSIPIIHGKAELEQHDAEISAKAIDKFVEALKAKCDSMNNEWNGNAQPTSWASAYEEFKTDVEDVAKQLKSDHIREVTKKVGEEGGK